MFKDHIITEQLSRDGYVKIDFIDKNKLASIKSEIKDNFSSNLYGGLAPSLDLMNSRMNHQISAYLKKTLHEYLNNILYDFKFNIGFFMTKRKDGGEFPLHQDWSIVDENKSRTYQIWIPLDDVSISNGCLFFWKGSQNLYRNLRSGSLGIPRILNFDQIKDKVEVIEVKMGEAVIYDNSVYHGSFANITNQDRVVIMLNISSRNHKLYYYHQNKILKKLNLIKIYELNIDDMLSNLINLENSQKPIYSVFEKFTIYNYLPNEKISIDFLKSLKKD